MGVAAACRIRAGVRGSSRRATALDDAPVVPRRLATRSLTPREADVWPSSADALEHRPEQASGAQLSGRSQSAQRDILRPVRGASRGPQ